MKCCIHSSDAQVGYCYNESEGNECSINAVYCTELLPTPPSMFFPNSEMRRRMQLYKANFKIKLNGYSVKSVNFP